jgi:hypothetical protein
MIQVDDLTVLTIQIKLKILDLLSKPIHLSLIGYAAVVS